MNEFTSDTFLNGHIKITQACRGYRFSIDAALLAAIPRPRKGDTLIDLGAGCGIISLILAFRYPQVKIEAVEMQADLAKLALRNVAANQMEEQVRVNTCDMRSLTVEEIGRPADWIITNPPYHRPNSGRINPIAQRALARHEINLNLPQLLQTTQRLLRTGGRFGIIYPSERAIDLLSEMRTMNIEPKWMQSIHSHVKDEARLILVQGVHNGKPGMVVAPPLVVYAPDGGYTPEVHRMLIP